jgi:hypothetical protein
MVLALTGCAVIAAIGVSLIIWNYTNGKHASRSTDTSQATSSQQPGSAPASANTANQDQNKTASAPGTTQQSAGANPSKNNTSSGGSSAGLAGSGSTVTPSEVAGLTDAGILSDYTGPSTISGGTVVIENKRFLGRLTINGGNVTIRNSSFNFGDYYHVLVNGGTVTVIHSEFDGMNTTTTADDLGISGDNLTVQWSLFKRFVNAMRPGNDSLLENNVIKNPNTAYAPAHTDGIEVYGGSNIIIRGNSINISGGAGETGCVNIATDFASIDNVVVENNDFTGGTYSLYARLQGAGSSITNIKVRNNRWHTPHIYGTHSVAPLSAVTEWTSNTLDGQSLAF